MEFFLIKDSLTPAAMEEAAAHEHPYVALATRGEFAENRAFFDMGIDMDIPLTPSTTSAEVNVDAVIGTFHIPDRKALTETAHTFACASSKNTRTAWMTWRSWPRGTRAKPCPTPWPPSAARSAA